MDDIRYNKSIVKNINESLIRKALQANGTDSFTKTKIVRETSLSFPTVSRILDEMVARGEIVGSGVDQTTGGRHARSYALNPNYAYVLCINMTRYRAISSTLINCLGEVVDRDEVPLKEGWSGVTDYLEVQDRLIEKKIKEFPKIKSISMGLPWGVANGVILFGAESREMENYNMQEHLENRFGLRARVENDMNVIATGAYNRIFNNDRSRSLACVHIGKTSCGCGLYIRGHLVRGRHGFAGELKYVAADRKKSLAVDYERNVTPEHIVTSVAQMVTAICCTVDPETIVFYQSEAMDGVLKKAEERCLDYLPKKVCPRLVESDCYTEDFEGGLIAFGLEQLLSGYEIVNR